MAFLLMKSEERPAVVLLALPIRRPLRREPPVLATLHTCARPAAVLGISLRDYRGLSPYLLTGSRCPKSGDELPTHMPEESNLQAISCKQPIAAEKTPQTPAQPVLTGPGRFFMVFGKYEQL